MISHEVSNVGELFVLSVEGSPCVETVEDVRCVQNVM